jgi:hypothetical protein
MVWRPSRVMARVPARWARGAHPVVGVQVFTVMQAAGPLEAGKLETVCWIGVGEDGRAGRSFPGEEVSSTKFRSTSSKATQACRLRGLPSLPNPLVCEPVSLRPDAAAMSLTSPR